jgi:hypothetical protein
MNVQAQAAPATAWRQAFFGVARIFGILSVACSAFALMLPPTMSVASSSDVAFWSGLREWINPVGFYSFVLMLIATSLSPQTTRGKLAALLVIAMILMFASILREAVFGIGVRS